MQRIESLYSSNFREVARSVSDHHGRDEVSVTEFAVKYFSDLWIQQHSEEFSIKEGGQVVYRGGSDAKVGVPDGVDEPTPVDEYTESDGYDEVPDDPEPLDFDPEYPDRLTDEGDEGGEQVEEQSDSDDDGDPDEESEKLTFSMQEGPPSSDDE